MDILFSLENTSPFALVTVLCCHERDPGERAVQRELPSHQWGVSSFTEANEHVISLPLSLNGGEAELLCI